MNIIYYIIYEQFITKMVKWNKQSVYYTLINIFSALRFAVLLVGINETFPNSNIQVFNLTIDFICAALCSSFSKIVRLQEVVSVEQWWMSAMVDVFAVAKMRMFLTVGGKGPICFPIIICSNILTEKNSLKIEFQY